MRIAKRKSTCALALALLSALVFGFTLLSLRPTLDHDSLSLISNAEEREETERGGEVNGAAWFMAQRTYGLGYIPQDAEIRAVEDMRQRMIPELAAKGFSLKKSAAGQLNWEYLGPGNIGGRLRGLVVHPTNPNILYAGSVSGGVWKSTNAGASWFPVMNDLITLNISALAMKPGDPNTLYAGTGEGLMYLDNLPGHGILKTSDGGNTWKRAHIAQGLNASFITAIAVSPASPNVVYAAGRKAYPPIGWPAETVPDPGINAIFKSNDNGETWQDVTTGKGIEHDPSRTFDNIPADVVVSPTDASVVYAAFGLYYWGGIWKSTTGGQTWSRLTNGLPDPNLPNMGYGRIKLAMAPSNPNVIYASFTYASKAGDTVDLVEEAMLGLWKTTNAGQSWTQMTTPLTSNQLNRNKGNTTALGSMGGYAHALIVHPTDPNIVFVGGLDIYKTTDGGNSWSQVSMWLRPGSPENPEGIPYVHADHHVFAFDRSTNPPTLYNGSDGGVARSRDLGQTWEELNHDLGVTQFYTFAVHPTNPSIMLGGTQDNGTPMFWNGGVNDWREVVGADGWQTYFDYTDPTRFYASTQRLGMARLVMNYAIGEVTDFKFIGYSDGSNGITQRDFNKAGYYAPYELSPNNPNVLILGTNRLLKSTNRGDSWSPISAEFDSSLVAVAIAEGNDNIIWFATTKQIFKTEDGGATYTNVTGANLPKRYLTDIEFDPSNNRNVYVTYSGYGTPHVFKSADAGASWTNLSNNLPDTPANTIQVHPQKPSQLFLGTDIGVFLSEDGGQTWQPCTNGLPTVQVTAIALHTKANRVYAATHGRGAYSAQLSGSGAAIIEVEPQELAITAKPGQTGTANFTISNRSDAALSYTITASGPPGLADAAIVTASLSGLASSEQSKLLAFDLATAQSVKGVTPVLHANAATTQTTPNTMAASDVLMLDDGDNGADNFVGFGPGSANSFYWINLFTLPGFGFRLESFDFFMRSESAPSNDVYVAVYDANGQRLLDSSLNLATSADGRWYSITLNNPVSFNAGSSFSILMGAANVISYPAGTDVDASIPNNSYYYDAGSGRYINLNTVSGFENGAFLIRAVGTKISGTNQPPVAKAQLSKSQAKVNEPITFDASQSVDPDGQITQYAWDFGDGNSSTQKVATHAYTRAGNFIPKLTVTDNQGATGQTIGFVTISPDSNNRLTVNPTRGTIAPRDAKTITATFDAQGLAEGEYQGQINITSNGGNLTLPVRIRVSNVASNELVYDDGTPTASYNWPKAGQGSAVRFTPPSKLTKVTQAKIFINDVTTGNQFNLRVLADANGAPGNTVYGPVPVTVANTGWTTFDLNGANISVNGDFYVMIEYNGTSRPYFGSEATPPLAKRSWDFDGRSWVLFDTEDYLIRATVEYGTTGVDDRNTDGATPKVFELAQNYPNPFWSEATSRSAGNPETTIKYQLPEQAQVELEVYDLTGRRVATLESGMKTTGVHLARWNGRDQAGRAVASGVYFYRMQATSRHGQRWVMTKKMTVMR